MYHCQFCGGILEQLERGGCGGHGSIHGCPNCDRIFEQVTGGIVATPGGETFRPLPNGSYKRFKETGSRWPKMGQY